jgi:hypothetical protein
MTSPSHPPRLDYSNYTWRRVQIMKLLVMQLSPFSRHLIPPRSYIYIYIYIYKLGQLTISASRQILVNTKTDFTINFYFKINNGCWNRAFIYGNLAPGFGWVTKESSRMVTWGVLFNFMWKKKKYSLRNEILSLFDDVNWFASSREVRIFVSNIVSIYTIHKSRFIPRRFPALRQYTRLAVRADQQIG